MKLRLLLFLVIFTFLTSCTKSEITPEQDASLIYKRFHGKYKIINSGSSEAVDINQDGRASTDLLQEISDLASAELEIRIPAPNNPVINSSFLLTQPWQQQFISPEDPTVKNPIVSVNYALQGVVRTFRFGPDLKEILVTPDSGQVDLNLFPLPESVIIEGNEHIRVVMEKRLYTSTGWKLVKITTLYKRYTMTT